MKRLLLLASALVCLGLSSGCMTNVAATSGDLGAGTDYKAPVIVPPGWIYQKTKAPLDVNFDSTKANPSKTGSASVGYVHVWPIITGLSFAFEDDLPLASAIKNGGISSVEYADYEVMNVLGVYTKFTVHAYGE